VKLPHLAEWNRRRTAVAERYDALLADLPLRTPARCEYSTHTFHQYTVRSEHREQFLAGLKERGVGATIYYPVPVHLQAAYAALGHGPGDFPVAEQVAEEVFSLPIYPELGEEQILRVAEAMREAAPVAWV
jgi:dTDP-4-amino-4,6-dideoxygalactose transaminase